VILVAGGARVDAGKTTFSTGLVADLAARAGDAVGVKPRAGNDYWYDHDDYRIASDSGRLYGKTRDASRPRARDRWRALGSGAVPRRSPGVDKSRSPALAADTRPNRHAG